MPDMTCVPDQNKVLYTTDSCGRSEFTKGWNKIKEWTRKSLKANTNSCLFLKIYPFEHTFVSVHRHAVNSPIKNFGGFSNQRMATYHQ